MKKIIVLLLILVMLSGCTTNNQSNDTNNNIVSMGNVEEVNDGRGQIVINSLDDIDAAIALMTLEEKAGQMIQAERGSISLNEIASYNIGSILSGGGSAPISNTPEGWIKMSNDMQKASRSSSSGIPIIYGIDAVHGHNNVEGAVLFPHNIGLGAANNETLMFEIGQAVGREITATGLHWNYAPAVSIVQDIRWGRTYEGFSEESERTSSLASAYIKGLESSNIISTTKHFIGDGYTNAGSGKGIYLLDQGDVVVAIDELLDLYLPAYRSAIDAGTQSIMVSYNSVAGVKMHEHKELLQDVLRNQLGFEGVIISDWEAIHALSGDLESQVASAINAGIDVLMQPNDWKEAYEAIVSNVEKGNISEQRINESVKRILTMKLSAGLFVDDFEKEAKPFSGSDVKSLARQAVSESMVLLKNKDVLPLNKDMKIYLTGPASDNVGVQSGGWSYSWQGEMNPDLNGGTSLKDALESVLSNHDGKLVETEEEADVVLLAMGEKPYAEMMGDTKDLSLRYPLALDNIVAIDTLEGSKPIVTIMIAGRPLLVGDYIDDWDAFVMAWLPGTEGLGMTDVLFGDKPFKGTLPMTWLVRSEDASNSVIMEGYDSLEHQFKFGDGLVD